MAIKKQEFYEGAALHQVTSGAGSIGILHDPPFFVLNERLCVMFKYCTKGRSPWNFTFGSHEQRSVKLRASTSEVVIGLICGDDGVAAIDSEEFFQIASIRDCSIRIACYRRHGEHYEITGPDGSLLGKIAPSRWKRITSSEDRNP